MSSELELGSKEARVAKWRDLFEGKSENELIHEMNSYIESSERHIAAKQLLTALQEAKENERHQETKCDPGPFDFRLIFGPFDFLCN